MERVLIFAVLLLGLLPAMVYAEGKRPLRIEDLFRFGRVADPQISPDGKWVVYSVGTPDLKTNKVATHLWLVSTTEGSEPRQLTASGKRDAHPRWSPDGKQILFESTRSGSNQLWVISLEGGEARQLTTISTGATGAIYSPDGKSIAFVSTVFPEFSGRPFAESDKLNAEKMEAIEKNPVKAKVFTKLFYRHWDEYVEDKRQHLFVMSAEGGAPRDITPGDRDYNPTSSTFSMGDDFCWTPDGTHLIVTAPPERNEAWSTDYALLRVPVGGGKIEDLTKDNPAADGGPCFSPDGKQFAYRAQKKPGYEADKWDILVVDVAGDGTFRGKPRNLTARLDRSVNSFAWIRPQRLIFGADDDGSSSLYQIDYFEGREEAILKLPLPGMNSSFAVCTKTQTLVSANSRMSRPNELLLWNAELTQPRNLSRANAKLLAELDLPQPESVRVEVAGAQMQMWILKPPGFDASKKWPLVYLVHGGPQGAWEDGWSFRWNPEIWAAQGYVIALPNPRGSTGFGQKFTDEISGDWGGKCFDDLMAGLAYLEKQPYIDTNRMASAGASFGGYMMNWFEGNTTKFKTLINHCGVFNFESMYATTEELWFDEWEHGGPPWGPNRASYEKHSPHRKAANFKTPMLIIHNDLDFRVPVSEGHQAFTTLQRLGIPSKFINFPDEGHWVLKPANSQYWHQEVFAWLAKYCPPGGK